MIALTNAKIIPVTQKIIENGKVKALGADIPIPENFEVIDYQGKWITLGLIDTHTHLRKNLI